MTQFVVDLNQAARGLRKVVVFLMVFTLVAANGLFDLGISDGAIGQLVILAGSFFVGNGVAHLRSHG